MNAGLEEWIARFLPVAARISGLMVFAPYFGSFAIAPRIKAVFAIVLTAVVYPVVAPEVAAVGASSGWKIAGGEFVLGLMMGLVLQFVFEGVNLAGQIVGFQVGHSLANLINPLLGSETPLISSLYQSLALLVFLQLNLHHWMLLELVKSFDLCPPGSIRLTPRAMEMIWHAAGGMFGVGLEVAIPVLAATMLTDFTLGFLGKASPQLPVLFVGISAKNLVAFVVLMGTLRFWPGLIEKYFGEAIAASEHLLRLLR